MLHVLADGVPKIFRVPRTHRGMQWLMVIVQPDHRIHTDSPMGGGHILRVLLSVCTGQHYFTVVNNKPFEIDDDTTECRSPRNTTEQPANSDGAIRLCVTLLVVRVFAEPSCVLCVRSLLFTPCDSKWSTCA